MWSLWRKSTPSIFVIEGGISMANWTDLNNTKWVEYIVQYLDDEGEWTFGTPCKSLNEAIDLEKKARLRHENVRVIEKVTTFKEV
jgi:hypothetical protein